MAQLRKILAPDFSDGVDRKLLKQVRDRFLQVNEGRMQKALDAMSYRHADILKVLPLLYHVNHPLLPGFVARETPRGLSNYAPDKATLSIAKSFSQTFRHRADRRARPEIQSLFMMGSSGTLAHSESSDVDVWLCHGPDLDPDQVASLKQKATKIDQWANGLGLELHTFLMNAEAFRNQAAELSVDAESSGSAQHYLLLDEFYRTAILMAGCYPLWWLVPLDKEHEYKACTDMLLTHRFIKQSDVVDFGSVSHIPKNELVGAGLWQLYKSLDAPYKSVLKLLLAEVYAQELPGAPCLSMTFKDAVYRDELEVEKLDPYYLIYKRLEEYLLKRKEVKRLELVRKSFYLKINKPLSRKPSSKGKSWQRMLLESMVRDWGWPDRNFKILDQRKQWKVDQVLAERQQLLTELTNSYRFLSDYSRAHNIASSITVSDLSLLGRKLYATFQRKAGKVERVNPGIAPNIWEENLSLHHGSTQEYENDPNAWLLYRDLNAGDDPALHASLKKSSSLLELLTWLYFNGIISSETRLSLSPGTSGVTIQELRNLVGALERSLENPQKSVPQAEFLRNAYVKKLVLFINVGVDPMEHLSEQGMLRLSDRTDSLVYSSQRYNLVKTIDQVALNSWNELSARRYELGETLMQNLQAYLLMCAEQLGAPQCKLSVYCYSSQRADAIAKRVKALFQDARNAFFAGSEVLPVRYVLELEECYYVIQYVDEQFRYSAFSDLDALMQHLAKSVKGYSQIALDAQALKEKHLLLNALKRARPKSLQVFFTQKAVGLELCVVDEHGSVLNQTLPPCEENLFVRSISAFLTTIMERRQLDHSMLERSDFPELEIVKVTIDASGTVNTKALPLKLKLEAYEVVATAFYDGLDLRYDLSFQGQDFCFADYGQNQIKALRHYLQSQSYYDADTPLVLRDISYPSDPILMRSASELSHSSLDYLKLYCEIETLLRLDNTAIPEPSSSKRDFP